MIGKSTASLDFRYRGLIWHQCKRKYTFAQSWSLVWLSATPCSVACKASFVHGIFQAEYWGRLPSRPLGDLLNPGIEPVSPASPALAEGFFTSEPIGRLQKDVEDIESQKIILRAWWQCDRVKIQEWQELYWRYNRSHVIRQIINYGKRLWQNQVRVAMNIELALTKIWG